MDGVELTSGTCFLLLQTRQCALKQNCRSIQPIVAASRHLIEHNKNRHAKQLYSQRPSQELIEIFHASSASEEAEAVVQRLIHYHHHEQIPWKEMAILYHSNILARPFEIALLQAPWNDQGTWKRGVFPTKPLVE